MRSLFRVAQKPIQRLLPFRVGAGEESVSAVLDDFGAESALVFAIRDGQPCRLAAATRRGAELPAVHFVDAGELIPQVASPEQGAPASGPVRCLALRDERRRAVGFLVVGYAAGRQPAGIEAYAAFVGQLLAVELGRHEEAADLAVALGAAA